MPAVTSRDGTSIAYEQDGNGPGLILVHGTTANRTRFDALRAYLTPQFTVTVMDRRGRGDSGDHPEYALEREFEDVAAVIDAVGASPLLFGHSFGALCALGAAERTDSVAGLILYEPWISTERFAITADELDRMDRLLAAGDRDGLVTMMFTEVAQMQPDEVAALRAAPSWPGRVASAHTIPRESRAENSFRVPAGGFAHVQVPVLLLLGGDSPPAFGEIIALLEAALPNARRVVMPGQTHIAMITAPDLLARVITDFWRDIRPVV